MQSPGKGALMWLDLVGLLVILIPCTILDIRKKKLPVIFLLVMLIAAFVTNLPLKRVPLWELIAGVLYGGMFLLVSVLTKGSVGFGDGIMIAAAGAWTGVLFVLSASIVGFLSAGIFGLVYIKVKKMDRKTKLPFAPFFTAACLALAIVELVTKGSL